MKMKEKSERRKGRRNKLAKRQIQKATQVLSERQRRRVELSRQRHEQCVRNTKELRSEEEERKRVEGEGEEGRRMELQQEILEKEEKDAERKVEERKERLRRRWQLREIERATEIEKELEKQRAIDRLKEELRKEEESLRAIRETSAVREKELENERNELQLVKALAAAKKAARIEAAKKADEHPHSLSLLYSRRCSICLSSNPRRRSVMVVCGHFTCSLCAERLADGNANGQFPCPFCRRPTNYVNTFEEVDEQQMRENSLRSRKRKMSGDENDEATSIKTPRVDEKF